MNVHENEIEVNDLVNTTTGTKNNKVIYVNICLDTEVYESLDNQFGSMESLLEQEDQRQKIDRLTKENIRIRIFIFAGILLLS